MLRVLLTLSFLTLSAGALQAQQPRPLVVVVNDLSFVNATHRGLRPRPHAIKPFTCDPHDPSCARADLLSSPADAELLFVRVTYERRGCVPLTRNGRVVGRRMMQAEVLTLSLFDHEGTLLRETREDMPRDATARRFVTQQIRAFFAQTP